MASDGLSSLDGSGSLGGLQLFQTPIELLELIERQTDPFRASQRLAPSGFDFEFLAGQPVYQS